MVYGLNFMIYVILTYLMEQKGVPEKPMGTSRLQVHGGELKLWNRRC